MDAIEQFSAKTPPVVRITSYVTPSATSAAAATTTTTPAAAAVSASSSTSGSGSATTTATATERTTDQGSSTRGDVHPTTVPPVVPPIPVQKVLESFVGILSTAVHHLQEGLTTHHPAIAAGSAAIAARTAEAIASKLITENNPHEETQSTANNVVPTTQPEGVSEGTENTTETNQGNTNTTETVPEVLASSGDSNQPSSNQEVEDPKPFIHGRHTCDSCLSTPIIGKRFHSINLPDYDLCQNCFSNYQGSDIQFESVELDRDRPFQDRWHRRHQRNFRMRGGRNGHRCGGGGRYGRGIVRVGPSGFAVRGPRRHHPMVGGPRRHAHKLNVASPSVVAPNMKPAPQSVAPSPSDGSRAAGSGIQRHASAPPSSMDNEFDTALKEAIRRSLSDIAPKEAAIASDTKSGDDADDVVGAVKGNNQPDHGVVVETVTGDEEEEDELEAAKPQSDIPRSIDCPTADMSAHTEDAKDDASLPGMEEIVAKMLKTAMEKSMDAASVDSEKWAGSEDGSDEDAKPPAVSPFSSRSSSKKDQSFASDAVGNGDVAEAIGATLDMVVGQISELLGEQEATVEEGSVPGQLIVDPHPTTEGQNNETDGDWSVVKSVVSTESDGTTEEEQIARAATMLGSALFNSDMNTSIENVSSKLSASGVSASSFSVPSTVPTEVGANSSVSPAQLARWCTQLEQLRGLGFDESRCVDVLERLSAANIGVDSEDEISLELVVNKLLEEQLK
jgi:Zinc finger, ZZ type